jgi:hypothetical protein
MNHSGARYNGVSASSSQMQTKPRFPGKKSYITMSFLLVLGIATAVGQDRYYSYLNGRQVNDLPMSQSWAIRIGTAFAFLFKTSLVAAVGIAFCHGFWYLVRRESIRLGGLDAMFGVLSNPLNFFNGDILVKTRILVLLALVCWLLPIAAILSPGALTGPFSEKLTLVDTQPLTTVGSMNAPVLGPLDADVGFVEVGSAGSFLGPTEQLRRIATRVLTSGEIIALPSQCGSNCSYTVSFAGPGYQCRKVDSIPSDVNLTSSGGNPNTSPFIYVAEGRRYSATSSPSVWALSLADQGLWIVRNFNPANITHCQLYQATYTTTVQYSQNLPTFNTTLTYHDQIPGSAGSVTQSNRSPTDLSQSQWQLLNQFCIHEAVASVLSGAISISSVYGGFNFQNTLIGMSDIGVVSPFHITYPSDFEKAVEEVLVNTTLSVNYFLGNPPISQIAGSNLSAPAVYTPTTATIVSYPPVYVYSSKTLWEVYGVAIIVSAICIAGGCYMLSQNGVDAAMSFSQILVTTRNETLDRHCNGAWMGGEYIPKTFLATEWKYGDLLEMSFAEGGVLRPVGHAAFGSEEEVRPLAK